MRVLGTVDPIEFSTGHSLTRGRVNVNSAVSRTPGAFDGRRGTLWVESFLNDLAPYSPSHFGRH